MRSSKTQTRGYNFGAGPSALPESILKEVQEELLDWKGMDMSVMEMGHRTPEVSQMILDTEQNLRDIMQIPSNYRVLFLGGACRSQFAMIPLNLLSATEEAGYLVTGIWSKMAFKEAEKIKHAYCIATGENQGFIDVPSSKNWHLKPNTKYVYFTPNETINGVRFIEPPCVGDIPLVADMTSCILSEPIDVSQYGLIFAGAQKNIANAGLTVVIIRDDLIGMNTSQTIPTMYDYKTFADTGSMYATPPTFNCYLANKMFLWIKAQGGVDALYRINCEKAARLYDYIDNSDFYETKVEKAARSLMNVCFSIKDSTLEPLFLSEAKKQALYALKGHKEVGGLRASIYNAMPLEGVDALIAFMKDFAKKM